MRVPQPPQKAKPGCTSRPQLGQLMSAAVAAPAIAAAPRAAAPGPTARPTFDRGVAVGPASGFGGRLKGTGAGILGESPHGIPPLGRLLAAGSRSSPAAAVIASPAA